MSKKLKAIVRLQLEAGKANPAPPVGPALAGHGINIMAFCKEYNARTSNRPGEVLPAEITVYTSSKSIFAPWRIPAIHRNRDWAIHRNRNCHKQVLRNCQSYSVI
jgi:large subunit ribosomal protein L11